MPAPRCPYATRRPAKLSRTFRSLPSRRWKQAIQSAHAAFRDRRWRDRRPVDRERLLLRFADLLEREADALAQLETLEQGKSIGISRNVEVGGAIEWTRYAAGLATKITGMTLDVSLAAPGTRATAFTRREPIGVVAGIVPWNFPLAIALWKVVPALAAGCAIVLKPSELTPLTALRLAELAIEAGIPKGVFNVVTGDGATGRALVSSPHVSKVSFTGSTETGKMIGRAAMDNMTRVSLELGGKNPAIVLKDADPEATIRGLMMGAFFNQGQVCAAASRVYVERTLFDTIAAGMESAVKGLVVGPGLDPDAQINPLVSAGHLGKVMSYLDDAATGGLELLQGADGPDPSGYYARPTLILNPDNRAKLVREEVFGPVLTLTRVENAEDAVKAANDSVMGLAASLWTRDLGATFDLIPQIDAGTVWVNSHVPIDPNLPFGGFKQSGIGRDFGPRWLDAYTEEKAVCITY
ncbi:aldehyde dehydrogenase family protein [Bradyrhizobium sp. Leo170]|uniref:aldehyde dehydrogenase family protein n=1 Tax=Bradyrhizobium sp. Leo170 TaxID=1571199 RepID=UPI0024C030A7|nr:aldehyde dehydrogenase family protein [Bradyrhizobium sp. Leo170]